jgi:serine/threonine protein kinase
LYSRCCCFGSSQIIKVAIGEEPLRAFDKEQEVRQYLLDKSPLLSPNFMPMVSKEGECNLEDGSFFKYSCMEKVPVLSDCLFTLSERENRLELAMRVGVELVDAISFLHSNGVVHTDIKPANICFKEGHIALLDFGNALIEGRKGRLSPLDIIGTRDYSSPQSFGEPESVIFSPKEADIWSFACTLWEVAFNENLFNEETHINRNPTEFFAMFTEFINSDEKNIGNFSEDNPKFLWNRVFIKTEDPSTAEADRQKLRVLKEVFKEIFSRTDNGLSLSWIKTRLESLG